MNKARQWPLDLKGTKMHKISVRITHGEMKGLMRYAQQQAEIEGQEPNISEIVRDALKYWIGPWDHGK